MYLGPLAQVGTGTLGLPVMHGVCGLEEGEAQEEMRGRSACCPGVTLAGK